MLSIFFSTKTVLGIKPSAPCTAGEPSTNSTSTPLLPFALKASTPWPHLDLGDSLCFQSSHFPINYSLLLDLFS